LDVCHFEPFSVKLLVKPSHTELICMLGDDSSYACHTIPLEKSGYLDLSSASASVKDTLGHTSTPVFSVDCCLFCIFPCHANWL